MRAKSLFVIRPHIAEWHLIGIGASKARERRGATKIDYLLTWISKSPLLTVSAGRVLGSCSYS